MIEDASTICTRHRIGVENILFESDYPHGDGTWPDTQAVIERVLGTLPVEEIRQITHGNAAKLYRHPLPAVVLP
jgi:predicted TIM-barrel fold metal-dependent hydrolase